MNNINNQIEKHYISFKDENNDDLHLKLEKETGIPFLSNFKEFIFERSLNPEEEQDGIGENDITDEQELTNYNNFLQQVIPSAHTLIDLLQQHFTLIKSGFSFYEMTKLLEPFLIYTKDITFGTYKKIRYFVNKSISEYRNKYIHTIREYRKIKSNYIFTTEPTKQNVISMFVNEKEHLYKMFLDFYFPFLNSTVPNLQKTYTAKFSLGEELKKMLKEDCCDLLTTFIQATKFNLKIPKELLSFIQNTNIDPTIDNNTFTVSEDNGEAVKNCIRRVLTKKYNSLKDLQKDNHTDNVFYDKELDETPYNLIKDYKKEKDKMTSGDFLDFFAEILVQKHSIQRDISKEIAENIILGKKKVRNGEYAILETYNTVLHVENDKVFDIPNVHDLQKSYYIRNNNVWKKDETIDETQFIDDNTLFCNLTQTNKCVKSKTGVCENIDNARDSQLRNTKLQMMKEFDNRIEQSIDNMKEYMERQLSNKIKYLTKLKTLNEIQDLKYNNLYFEIGKMAVQEELVRSPYLTLFELIISQNDFEKKQKDILTLVDKFAREPMVELLGESPYWYYCKDTNTPLLPQYIYELAKSFVTGGSDQYSLKLKEIIRTHGTLSEDGENIIDKLSGSGRIISKIDYVEEEIYNDLGFRIHANDIIQKDISLVIGKELEKNKDYLFKDEKTSVLYNIFTTICRNMGVPTYDIQEFVIRVSYETMPLIITSKENYEKLIEKRAKKGEKTATYENYQNQNIILIVAFVTLVAIQTIIPSIQPSKNVPNCVFSFSGFPLEDGNTANIGGLEYIACVLNISKSPIEPWSAINKIKNPIPTFVKNMKEIVAKYVIQRDDVTNLYIKKREYLILHPEESIPTQQSLQRWMRFTPPIVPISIISKIQAFENGFFEHFRKSITKGDIIQWNEIGYIQHSMLQYSFSIFEYINETVQNNISILKTSSQIPFLQNACCNENNVSQSVIQYFIEKKPEIQNYISIIRKITEVFRWNLQISKPVTYIETSNTLQQITNIPSVHTVQNIYAAFIHYCKFDLLDALIPEYLKSFIANKPLINDEYNPKWSIQEKINYLKENGKNYGETEFLELISLVNKQNIVKNVSTEIMSLPDIQIPNTDVMIDFINDLTNSNSSIIELPLRKHLMEVLVNYKKNTMMVEETDEIASLKNYLYRANNEMLHTIEQFMDTYRGTLEQSSIENIKDYLQNLMKWDDDELNEGGISDNLIQYIKNAILEMSVIFPELIINGKLTNKSVHSHWEISSQHQTDIENYITSYYTGMNSFIGSNNVAIHHLLKRAMRSLKEIRDFMEYIPIIQPITKTINSSKNGSPSSQPDNFIFYSVFNKNTVYLLFKYLFYSVIYEFIQLSNNKELLKIDMLEINKNKLEIYKKIIKDDSNLVEVDMDIQTSTIQEIPDQIFQGKVENIKLRMNELLYIFLNIQKDNKKAINHTYNSIYERVIRSKLEEKKAITDYFKEMTNEDRKLEYIFKKMKLGRWNLGMQKGVFQYDKKIYDNERENIITSLHNNEIGNTEIGQNEIGQIENIINLPFDEIERTVEDLEKEANDEQENNEENEYWNINENGEDNGDYYEEDREADYDYY
jgi:hypothetical protein